MNSRLRLLRAFVALTVAIPLVLSAAQESEAELERFHRVSDLLNFLDARPGAVIADVGAGDGFFTVRIARAVASDGRVTAEDISETPLKKLRERVAREQTGNVDVVLGAADDPRLPIERFDAVLIHNAYHEMTEHEAMLRHIREALKPGGRLLVVEPMHESSRGLSREKQVAHHDIEIGIVEGELRAVGFDVVVRDTDFAKFNGVAGAYWLILARRP